MQELAELSLGLSTDQSAQDLVLAAVREPNLFLSHNSHDKPFVRRLAHALNYFGLDAWIDEWEITPGEPLHQKIGSAMEYAKYIGIIISPTFLNSRWCMDELSQALAREKRTNLRVIVPILYKTARLPPFVEDRLYLDFRNTPLRALTQLCGMLYEATPKQISDMIEDTEPTSKATVCRQLRGLGWNGWRYLRSHDMAALAALLRKAGFRVNDPKKFKLTVAMIAYIKHHMSSNVLLERIFRDNIQRLGADGRSDERTVVANPPPPPLLRQEDHHAEAQGGTGTLPAGNLDNIKIPWSIIELMPESVARENCVIPFGKVGEVVHVFISDSKDYETLTKLMFILNREIEARDCPREMIVEAINKHYGSTETESVDW